MGCVSVTSCSGAFTKTTGPAPGRSWAPPEGLVVCFDRVHAPGTERAQSEVIGIGDRVLLAPTCGHLAVRVRSRQ